MIYIIRRKATIKIHFADSSYQIDGDFKRKYIAEVERAYKEASKLLPFGSSYINFFIQPREYGLIEETQGNGYTHNSELIELAFNPVIGSGGLETVIRNIRPSVFHEMNHASRYNIPIFHKSLIDACIMEGLATVFERDYTGSAPLHGEYPESVIDWLAEIRGLGDTRSWEEYMFIHPDGRRWIGYKVGTYIVDEAIKRSEKSVIELTQMECTDIIDAAGEQS